jgi:pimeloyl-ACP methyl ester carboxylesterase
VESYVYLIPGFMGSALSVYQQRPGTAAPGVRIADLWGTPLAVRNANHINLLALPGSLPPGNSIVASGLNSVAGEGYENLGLYISKNMPSSFTYSPWPYDWRQSAADLGTALAAQLVSTSRKGITNIVVAHSFGALVAWYAWSVLVDQGQQAALNRLITFGGALYGSSSTPNLFRVDEPALELGAAVLTILDQRLLFLAGLGALGVPVAGQITAAQVARLLGIVKTWPGVYDLYPDISLLDDSADFFRNLLFDSTKWGAALVQPDFVKLGAEVQSVHQHLRQAKYAIPAAQVGHIVGKGHKTPYRTAPAQMTLQQAQQFGLTQVPRLNDLQTRRLALPYETTTSDGDGRCTINQQCFPGAYTQSVASQHAAMPLDPAVQQLIVAMLTMTFPTFPTPPPLQVQTVWEGPHALPDAPPFIFNNDPVNTQQAGDPAFKVKGLAPVPTLKSQLG